MLLVYVEFTNNMNIYGFQLMFYNVFICQMEPARVVFYHRIYFMYIFDVLVTVRKSLVGCYIGSTACNILLYADDIVLLSPTWHAQQTLLDLCCTEVNSLVMKFDMIKSVTLIFVPYKSK